ncbi:hypothetical protein TWF481_005966 [Arthrobotrys musiformis]|uniref:Neprosin domain-containing protein n=1 Tax=Arthrobotrys musiformis TaxID=47236 RepID=A0AAV9WHE2_9PEZI
MASADASSKLTVKPEKFTFSHPPEDVEEVEVKERPTVDLSTIRVSPNDLFKIRKPPSGPAGGVEKLDTDPRGGEDGKLGAAIGKILYELFESYQDWANNQGAFVSALLDRTMDEEEVWSNRLSVMIFANPCAEYFFINHTYVDIDNTAWFGVLDRCYTMVVFEAGWFVRYGKGGWINWGFGWNGNEVDNGQRVAITYTGYNHSPGACGPQAILDYDGSSGHNIAGIRPMVMQSSSTSWDNTRWIASRWGERNEHWGQGTPW